MNIKDKEILKAVRENREVIHKGIKLKAEILSNEKEKTVQCYFLSAEGK